MQVERHHRSPNAAAVVAVLAAVVVATMGLGLATCCRERVRPVVVALAELSVTTAKTGPGRATLKNTRQQVTRRHSPGHDPSPSLSVLTYNVNYQRRRPSTVQAIFVLDADVVFLQETNRAWERYLRFHLKDHYPHVAYHHSRGAGGLAVLSRYPFETKRIIPSAVGKFPAWRLVVQGPFGPVQVLNLHLRPIYWRGPDSVIARYYRTQKNRILETRAVLPHIDKTLPTVLLGDFNEDISGQSLQLLLGRGYTSAAHRFAPDAPTWRWKVRATEIRWQLDHILHGPRLEARSFRIFEAGGSDHFPLLTVLAPKPPPAPHL